MRLLNDMFPARVLSQRGNSEWPARSPDLNDMFPARVLSRRGRPARSPDLNACDFFLWGYLKGKVYEKKPRTMVYLKQNIRDEVAAISPTMLQQVMQNFQKCLWECVDKGRHRTDTIFRK